MINCNLLIFSFLAFTTMWILAAANDASSMQMTHRTSASILGTPRIVAQIYDK